MSPEKPEKLQTMKVFADPFTYRVATFELLLESPPCRAFAGWGPTDLHATPPFVLSSLRAFARLSHSGDTVPMNHPIFGYYINQDERGCFEADVRNEAGNTVFDIAAGDSLSEDESSIFEDGFMRDKHDIRGLEEHMKSLGLIPSDGQLMPMKEFEDELENRQAETPSSGMPGL